MPFKTKFANGFLETMQRLGPTASDSLTLAQLLAGFSRLMGHRLPFEYSSNSYQWASLMPPSQHWLLQSTAFTMYLLAPLARLVEKLRK
jgi:hypothetical protein